jgi:hypothetical protein
LAFLAAPVLPTALQSYVPVGNTMLFVVAALAVCAVVGWWNGGNPLLAVIWLAIAGWMFFAPLGADGTSSTYDQLSRGWVLLIVAAFGVASLLAPTQGFFGRAVSAVGIATVGAFMLTVAVPDGIANIQQTAITESSRRTEQMIATFEQAVSSPTWRAMIQKHPGLQGMIAENEADMRKSPERLGEALPALLALESLAALALGWSVFHRLSTTRIGPSLGYLRDFRFNDQLIWGLAVGATLFFLPTFADGKGAGINLLLFFGALYLLRGIGVLSWLTRGRGIGIGLILLTAVAPFVVGALALGVGVGDTWMDWRSRISPAT